MNVKTNSTRVVITGMGIVSPLGNDIDIFWDKLIHGISGIGPMTLCDPTDYHCKIAGEATDFDPREFIEGKEANRLSRFIQLAIASALMAVEHSELNLSTIDLSRTGVILGNGNGGFPELEKSVRTLVSRGGSKISPYLIPTVLPNMASAAVSRFIKATGYNATIATACSAGTHAIGEAA
jgi:3-oxoacyl-[acyl-carrier-protein] synthase II